MGTISAPKPRRQGPSLTAADSRQETRALELQAATATAPVPAPASSGLEWAWDAANAVLRSPETIPPPPLTGQEEDVPDQARALVETIYHLAVENRLAQEQQVQAGNRWAWFGNRRNWIRLSGLNIRNPEASGGEVWLLAVRTGAVPLGLPLVPRPGLMEFRPGTLQTHADASVPHGRCLRFTGSGGLRIAHQPGLRLHLRAHPAGGMLCIERDGLTQIFDLFARNAATFEVNPLVYPMTIAPVSGSSCHQIPRFR